MTKGDKQMEQDKGASPDDSFGDYDDWGDDNCYECGGEGFIAHCFEEWSCLDPDYGCDLCTVRCDVCNPAKPAGEAQRAATTGAVHEHAVAGGHAPKTQQETNDD